jgi:hypothetical protein
VFLSVKALVAKTHAYPDKSRPIVTNKDREVDAMEQLIKDNINKANAAVQAVSSDVEQEVSTAFVILFKNLRIQQAAIQCHLTGYPDVIVSFVATNANDTLWGNKHSRAAGMPAIPITVRHGRAQWSSMWKVLQLGQTDEEAAWYGLLAGLLPVLVAAARRSGFIRYKSMIKVGSRTLHWHMLFQFANLCLIRIGGSLFNQTDQLPA